MEGLKALSRYIDVMGRWLGVVANWLVLAAALLCALDAGLRYGVNGLLGLAAATGSDGGFSQWLFAIYRDNSNTLRDLQLVCFAGMVMLGSSWTLKLNEHVRVDIFYTSVSDRARTWIDLTGTILFLGPFCILMIYLSWGWFYESWVTDEMSANAGGLPRWPLKAFLPLGFALILLQGVSELIKCIVSLKTGVRREHAYVKPVQ